MAEEKHDDYLHQLRHSVSHVMAQAVLEKFPEGKIAIGPPIENGFYYDFDLPRPLTPEDLEDIQARMHEIVAEGHDFVYQEISEEEGRQLFADQPYKLELIDAILSAGTDEYGEPLDEEPKLMGVKLAGDLRAVGIGALTSFGERSLKAQLRQANKEDVAFTLIIGETEAEAGQVTVRDMVQGEQYPVALEEVATWLSQRLGRD